MTTTIDSSEDCHMDLAYRFVEVGSEWLVTSFVGLLGCCPSMVLTALDSRKVCESNLRLISVGAV